MSTTTIRPEGELLDRRIDSTFNLNTLPDMNGFFSWGNSSRPTNYPVAAPGLMLQLILNSSYSAQLVISLVSGGTPRVHVRQKYNTTWSNWVELT